MWYNNNNNNNLVEMILMSGQTLVSHQKLCENVVDCEPVVHINSELSENGPQDGLDDCDWYRRQKAQPVGCSES